MVTGWHRRYVGALGEAGILVHASDDAHDVAPNANAVPRSGVDSCERFNVEFQTTPVRRSTPGLVPQRAAQTSR